MRSAWRFLLTCLLALALPLQGLAASRMHLGLAAPATSAATAHSPAHGTAAAAELPPCHQLTAADEAPDSDAPAPVPKHSCAACALCAAYAGLGLPALAGAHFPPLVHAAPPAAPAEPQPAFLTDGPERPPRAAAAR